MQVYVFRLNEDSKTGVPLLLDLDLSLTIEYQLGSKFLLATHKHAWSNLLKGIMETEITDVGVLSDSWETCSHLEQCPYRT